MENCLELLSVTTLRQRLDTGGPLSLCEASVIVDRIAEALDAIHVKGNVHGAVNPGNVLLLPGNQVQLLSPKTAAAASVRLATGRSGRAFVGNVLYISPEEVRGASPTAATDIWGLGALLYEMLTGFPPFIALRVSMLRDLVTNSEPDLLPHALCAAQFVVDRSLAKWPTNRFESAQELANTLWAAAPSLPVSSRPVLTLTGGSATDSRAAVVSAQPTLSLQQAVNRPLTLVPAPRPSNRAASETRGWMRFFGGRRQVSSRAAA